MGRFDGACLDVLELQKCAAGGGGLITDWLPPYRVADSLLGGGSASRGLEWAVGGVGSRGTAMAWLFWVKNGCKMETDGLGAGPSRAPGPCFSACEASPSSPPPLALLPSSKQAHMMSAKEEASKHIAVADWLQCRSGGPNAVNVHSNPGKFVGGALVKIRNFTTEQRL